MFRCFVGPHTTKPGQRRHLLVTKQRDRDYTDNYGDVIATGWEIVEEKPICEHHLQSIQRAQIASAAKAVADEFLMMEARARE